MILHIIFDDKFADYAIKQFKNQSVESSFVLISDGSPIKYIHQVDDVLAIQEESQKFNDFLYSLKDYNAVLFHGLFMPWQEKILDSIPSRVKVAWMFWGAEIYGRKDIVSLFMKPYSKYLYRLHSLKLFFKRGLKKSSSYFIPKSCFQRVDFCLTFLEWEFLYAKKYLSNSMSMIWYNYYSIEETLGTLINQKAIGHNVFVGNSCSIENNHWEVFNILSKRTFPEVKLIVPLSYGEPWLRNLLVKRGKSLFHNRFVPLLEYMSLESYNKTMLQCGAMIMNHIRPQAQGNILTGLWLGMRVYLSKQNPVLDYFKSYGIIIFSIEEDLQSFTDKCFSPLTEAELKHNRRILLEIAGKQTMQESVLNVIKNLDCDGDKTTC